MGPTSRAAELERLDNWLLARSAWRLRQLALLIALAINVPNAWSLFRAASGPDVASIQGRADAFEALQQLR